ncbi:chemotaxis protein CheW [Halioxenophilus sp. WMMB6]|uniref:chemotaxis protein CheW n=1 Tax=Halioxenophilus sp. WMMB6 TaxID=3073815 RepID=UPI00295F2948|nr:chemotaxis protein CheW [Halioxenophilus sp. WMMB6]
MDQSNAFQALLNLANRSRTVAKGLPASEQTKQEWSGIGFGLIGQRFVVPLGQVSELLEVPSYTRLPGVKHWVRGVANVRGRLLPVIDLAMYLGHRLTTPHKQQRILIIENQELYCGLLVDQAFGMQHFLTETYNPDNTAEDAQLLPYLLGNYPQGDITWHIFSMVNLAESPQFMSAAKSQLAG